MIRILILLSVLALSSIYSVGQTLFTITQQPVTPLAICSGNTGTLSISSNGNNDRYYQWQKFNTTTGAYVNLVNGTSYTNAVVTLVNPNRSNVTFFSINTSVTGAAGAGTYRCVVRDAATGPILNSTAVTVTIVSPPPTPTTTNGYTCTSGTSVVLNASGATGTQTYQWYFGGKPINGETAATYVTPAISVNTNYYVTIDNGVCESAQVLAVAQVFTPPAAPTITNGSSCGPAAVVLNAAGATNGQYRWYTLAGKTPIAGETNSSFTTPTLTSTTSYNVSVYNGSCESSRVAISATINIIPAAPTTTGSAACGTSSLTLNAVGGANGQYRWYTTSTQGTPITGQTFSSFVTPSLTTTTTYFVSINNGTCESARASVVAQINSIPTAPTTTGNASCGSPASLQLNASGGTNGQYRWYGSATDQNPIPAQNNSSFNTPSISSTSIYYVSIYNGTCESIRAAATAEVNIPPAAAVAVSNSLCTSGSVALGATGAKDGEYRWYTSSTGGQPITGEVNGKYLTPSITTTSTFYVSINNGKCESSTRTPVIARIGGSGCNNAPVIQAVPITTQIEGKVTLDLVALISDADKNLDLNTLKVVVQPASGASASITTGHALILDYSSTPFSGLEFLTIEVCDLAGACTQKQLSVEVAGDIVVYNAISPGNDGKNDIFLIKYIDILNNTQKNHVYIYSRWGDVVFDMVDYNNTTKVFRGLNNSGNEIPSGTYFYKIEFAKGKESKTGYLTIKK